MAVSTSLLRTALDRDGYVVVPRVVPPENLDAVVQDMWRHTGASPNDRETWYNADLISKNGMVEMYHYPSMWNNRQYPQLHEVFTEVYGTPKLWVSLDRTNLKPPADPAHPEHNQTGFIHWDTDTSLYPNIPFRVQAALALTDTDDSMGGFQCVPELFRDLASWIPKQPPDRNPRVPDLTGYAITKVDMRAGDVVIWSTLMPHGNGHNISAKPRLAQYITMSPARDDDEELRQVRIACWRERRPPPGKPFPGDPRHIEEEHGTMAELTPLGQKLLGLDRW